MKKSVITYIALLMFYAFSVHSQDLLWDNGGMVTHPGAGAGGFDVSMASQIPYDFVGSNVRNIPGQDYHRNANDFIVSLSTSVTSIITYAFQTDDNFPVWTGFNMNIWDGRPGDVGSNIIASTTSASYAATNVYKIYNGAANLGNTQRLIQEIVWDLNNLALSPGTYWIDWQVDGPINIWAPYVMEPNLVDIHQPITVTGNGRHLNSTGNWVDLVPFAPEPVETPFQVYGIQQIPTLGEWGLMFLGLFLLLLVTITTKLDSTLSIKILLSKLYSKKQAFAGSLIVLSIAYLTMVLPLFVYFGVSTVWDIPMGLMFCLLIAFWWQIAKMEQVNQPVLMLQEKA